MSTRFTIHNRWLSGVGFEWLCGFIVFFFGARTMLGLYEEGYLQQPFFYMPFDTWMDWFNPAYWAHDPGVYDSWGTIYPPLTFVFLNIFGIASCYADAGGLSARECDWLGVAALHGFYIIDIVLIALMYIKIDRRTALPRAYALAAGLPMLFTLERGNVLIATVACMIVAFGPLVKQARWRWLGIALAINFKVYLIGALIPLLIRRRWRWFEGAVIMTILVYIVTFLILGSGTPMQIYSNILDFANTYQASGFLDLWYAATYGPIVSLLTGYQFPITDYIDSNVVEYWAVVLPRVLLGVQLTIGLALFAAWLRPEVVPMFRLTGFGVTLPLITNEPGGYALMLIIMFVFMERFEGIGRRCAILTAYILSIPADIVITRTNPAVFESWLGGHSVITQYAISVGPVVRPMLTMSIPFALAMVTIRAVWIDIRVQGWRGRWRFRRDVPIMTGDGGFSLPRPASLHPAPLLA